MYLGWAAVACGLLDLGTPAAVVNEWIGGRAVFQCYSLLYPAVKDGYGWYV